MVLSAFSAYSAVNGFLAGDGGRETEDVFMKLLVLGKGKFGSEVIELARGRGHEVEAHDEFDNPHGCLLTPDR
jgi:hypothetical protein